MVFVADVQSDGESDPCRPEELGSTLFRWPATGTEIPDENRLLGWLGGYDKGKAGSRVHLFNWFHMIDIKHDDPLQQAIAIVNSLISPILIKLHCANVTNCSVPPVKAYLMNACSFMQSFR